MSLIEKKYGFRSLDEIVEFSSSQNDFWFRGHSKPYGTLIPSVYRGLYKDAYDKECVSPRRPLGTLLAEYYLYNNFKRIAPSFTKKLPATGDYLEWLSLMQHHGVPTRLLDWTTNILVAAYFAVYKDYDVDGEIFAMDYGELNKESELRELPLKEDFKLQETASEPFFHDKVPIKSYPIAFMPVLFHERILRQNGAFTIHPNKSEEYSIEKALLKKQNRLIRLIIPAQFKSEIQKSLANIGIEHATLFPDLDGLAITLIRRYETNIIGNINPDMHKFILDD